MNTLRSLQRKFKYGFTLIELLLVIGIIAILAAIVIVAINPTKQLGDARDSQRRSDVNTILSAVYQFAIDNNGNLPGELSGSLASGTYALCYVACTSTNVTSLTANTGDATGLMYRTYLAGLVGDYLTAIPSDPRYATSPDSYYALELGTGGRVTVKSLRPEASGSTSGTISVER